MTDEQLSPEGEEIVIDDNVEAEAETENQEEAEQASDNANAEKQGKPKAEAAPTVPLSDFSNLKDIVSRLIGDDPEKLLEIAESDPKLASRIKDQFPKRFKDVTLSREHEDTDEKVNKLVNEKFEQVRKQDALDNFREKLGMTNIEFSDIKAKLSTKADSLLKSETVDDYKTALRMALQIIDPDLYSEISSNESVRANKVTSVNKSVVSQKQSKGSELSAMEQKFARNLPPTFKI